VLGRFDLVRNGVALKSGGKVQRRVFDLLKAVIAAGSRGVPIESLSATLWPDAEGDAAKEAFDVTLHRLRRLLGGVHAVAVSGAKVSINKDVCWVDAIAFEQAMERMDTDTLRAADHALQLYCGPLLWSDGDRPWLLAQRERLHSRFLRCMDRGGAAREQVGDLDGAVDLYRRVIELDPLGERFYRKLMGCYLREDRHAEALETYRRCRQMLSLMLGVRPSAETEAMYNALNVATGPSSQNH
jgi:DNA-binding SARP family transcriptional activator